MTLERAGYYRIVLSIFLGDHLDDTLNRVLDPLGKAIANIGTEIDNAVSKFGSDTDWWIEDEVVVIEELLGVAFVACQAQITYIVSGIQRLHKHAKKLDSKQLTKTDGTKASIMQYGFARNAEIPYSPIEIIDAFANYYKHSDQWSVEGVDWDKPQTYGLAKHTIPVVKFASAEQGSTGGNLRAGASYLGNPEFRDLSVFIAILSGWRKNLVSAYEAELKAEGLIQVAKPKKRRKARAQAKSLRKTKRITRERRERPES